MNKKIVVSVVGLILFFIGLGVLLWFSSHSVIAVTVQNPNNNDEIQYTLTDASGHAETYKSSSSSFSKVVSKSTYQVTVQQTGKSYLAVASTNPFLRKSNVNATLAGESARSFVGNNPAYCMNYVGDRLVSGECFGDVSTYQVHLPPSQRSAQYTTKLPAGSAIGSIEGTATTKLGTIVLSQALNPEEAIIGHYASVMGNDLVTRNRVRLDGLDNNKLYTIKPYRDGFIVYNTDISELFYVSNLGTKPEKISVTKPVDNKMKPRQLGVYADTIAILYSPGGVTGTEDGIDKDFDESDYATDGTNQKSSKNEAADQEVVTITAGTQNHVALKGAYYAVLPCGSDLLCLQSQGTVDVYTVDGNKAKLAYGMPGFQNMEVTGQTILFVSKTGLLKFDPQKREGNYTYSFGGYTYCGIGSSSSGYLVCIGSNETGKAALLLNPSASDTDQIDKKILQLTKEDGIDSVTAYGTVVNIVPDYSRIKPVYNPALGIALADPAQKLALNEKIAKSVTKVGIKAPYQVYNFGQK